ncbi:MAG: hypothetical protein IMF03_02790 [Proteobacteria bacterium]|nr:hypothetical protein [Pseudomonadota bacterium]
MGFDAKKFLQTQLVPREETVPVPDMKDFFPEGEKPEWKVRGLTGVELARSNEAVARNKDIAAILEGLISQNNQAKIDSVKQLIGTDDKVPNDIAKRIELFIMGSVEAVDIDIANKICTAFPVEFFEITNKITVLTGQGHVPGKPKPSGETQKSK